MLEIHNVDACSSDMIETLFEEIKSSPKKHLIGQLRENSDLCNFSLKNFGLKRTYELIQNIKITTYKYWNNLLLENPGFAKEALMKINQFELNTIADFMIISEKLILKDRETFALLLETSKRLKSTMKLSNILSYPENYTKNIIYNKSCFSREKKIQVLLNASKNLMLSNIIKKGNLFLNTSTNGYIRPDSNCSDKESCMYGLFYNDMQYIDSFCLNVFDSKGETLAITENIFDNKDDKAYISLSYDDRLFVRTYRKIADGVQDEMEIFNNSSEDIKLNIDIISEIKDVFQLRGNQLDSNIYTIEVIDNNRIIINFVYSSGNKYSFCVSLRHKHDEIKPIIEASEQCKITYNLDIPAGEGLLYELKMLPLGVEIPRDDFFKLPEVKVKGSIKNIDITVDRAVRDLKLLTNTIKIRGKNYQYLSAGLPRYSTLFGRDSILSSLSLLELSPEIAKDTIEILAYLQGKTFEDRFAYEIKEIEKNMWAKHSKEVVKKSLREFYDYREEKNGKIIHEIRFGELAKTGEVPHSSYYGTIDATPLWLILVAKYYEKTKDNEFLMSYMQNIQDAILWIIDNFSDGYLKFVGSCSQNTIQNQGWKDANDSLCHILDLKGELKNPPYPVALAEVQAYVYKAFEMFSKIFNDIGKKQTAAQLKDFSTTLKERFNNDFFLEDKAFFATALDAYNRPIDSLTSNIGHCLTFDIIDEDKKELVEEYLMSKDMFSGYGIRTLSAKHDAYDPLSYHNGSVWVHDTLINVAGLSKESQETILKALFEAANNFPDNHLPEVFAGFSDKHPPILYPDTCIPQAWAAAGVLGVLSRYIRKFGKPEWIDEFDAV